jgi:hypothetical protein
MRIVAIRYASAEIETYAGQLSWILDQVAEIADSLNDKQRAWRPDVANANSCDMILGHIVGATMAYALGLACGVPVRRNRSHEFSTSGIGGTTLRDLRVNIKTELARLTVPDLDRVLSPSQEVWGASEPHEVSAREALAESLRHAALHLGELRLTRDLALSATAHGC